MSIYTGYIHDLKDDQIYVFGSNTQGRHGKGAALIAHKRFGAIKGQAKGLQGRSYAIVTKDLTKSSHPSVSSTEIIEQIKELYSYATSTSTKEYVVAYHGMRINLNGYSPSEMANMFASAGKIPANICFEESFYKMIEEWTCKSI